MSLHHQGSTPHNNDVGSPGASSMATAIPAFTALDQFVALLASSHPRAGSRSPARPVCSVSPLTRRVWRIVVSDVVEVVLTVEPSILVAGATESWRVSFSVSRATLGVVADVAPRRQCEHPSPVWVTPRLWLHREADDDGSSGWWMLMTNYGGCPKVVHVVGVRIPPACAINWKWFVTCERSLGDLQEEYALKIRDISDGAESQGTLAPVAIPMQESPDLRYCGLFFNKVAPDEALVVMLRDAPCKVSFTLFDVGKTYSGSDNEEDKWRCDVHFEATSEELVANGGGICSGAQNWEFNTDCGELSSAVTGYYYNNATLWDCNNLATPLREVVDPCSSSGSLYQEDHICP
ncbi:hypothetical protein Pelo_18090 [Pelomyxa schiedti]|nr:hypothetical protein Pelo_18090 [Pelomyxa schiedti]